MASFFSADGGPIWIKCRRLVQNDVMTAVIWSKSKPDVEFQYGGRLGEFNGRATCHIAECNNSIRHIENRFRHILFYVCYLMQFGL